MATTWIERRRAENWELEVKEQARRDAQEQQQRDAAAAALAAGAFQCARPGCALTADAAGGLCRKHRLAALL